MINKLKFEYRRVGAALAGLLPGNNALKYFLLTDDNTQRYCAPKIHGALPVDTITYVMPAGEGSKDLKTCTGIWDLLFSNKFTKSEYMVNLGGGVVCDTGAFAASLYKRGIPFIHIPTTLLAMVDAAIGGKASVNYGHVKNGLGFIRQPECIIIDVSFLETLPERHLLNGFAEMLKHGLIASRDHWQRLVAIEKPGELMDESLIRDSAMIKLSIVERDVEEQGLRKILNFGHTIGHALESHALAGGMDVLHGEAIATGMICESYLSHKRCGLPRSQLHAIVESVLRYFNPLPVPVVEYQKILNFIEQDKKNQGELINFSLIKEIGEGVYDINCTPELIFESLDFLNEVV